MAVIPFLGDLAYVPKCTVGKYETEIGHLMLDRNTRTTNEVIKRISIQIPVITKNIRRKRASQIGKKN